MAASTARKRLRTTRKSSTPKRKPAKRTAPAKGTTAPHLQGTLVSGMGVSRRFIAMEHYAQFLAQYLGLRPYAGTLNIRVKPKEKEAFISGKIRLHLEGFRDGGKQFGGLSAYPVKLNGRIPSLLVVPDRTTHPPHIAEVVAVANLRRGLKLRNGSPITLE